jgi:hypothetical protein
MSWLATRWVLNFLQPVIPTKRKTTVRSGPVISTYVHHSHYRVLPCYSDFLTETIFIVHKDLYNYSLTLEKHVADEKYKISPTYFFTTACTPNTRVFQLFLPTRSVDLMCISIPHTLAVVRVTTHMNLRNNSLHRLVLSFKFENFHIFPGILDVFLTSFLHLFSFLQAKPNQTLIWSTSIWYLLLFAAFLTV